MSSLYCHHLQSALIWSITTTNYKKRRHIGFFYSTHRKLHSIRQLTPHIAWQRKSKYMQLKIIPFYLTFYLKPRQVYSLRTTPVAHWTEVPENYLGFALDLFSHQKSHTMISLHSITFLPTFSGGFGGSGKFSALAKENQKAMRLLSELKHIFQATLK